MDEYCDAIQHEGLVFVATTRGTVFAWDPHSFSTFVFHHYYNCVLRMHVDEIIIITMENKRTESIMIPCSKINLCTRMSTMMQLNTRILCWLPPLVALFLHGILVVSVRLSSTIIIIVSSTCMPVSKFTFRLVIVGTNLD